jgi:GntR family transcriptional regulator, histidine utilization repressor
VTSRQSITTSDSGRQRQTISLHHRILKEIREQILSGAWPPGHRIPSEHELTVAYGCSRMTVNKVMTQLVEAGLIERRRRAGSFVRAPRSQSAMLLIQDIKAEVTALGLAYHHKIERMRVRQAAESDIEQLGLKAPGRVLEIQCNHFASSRIFCVERRLINLSVVPEAAAATFQDEPPGPWLVRHVPWTAAQHRIRALAADDDIAIAFGVELGSACLVIDRTTWQARRLVTFVNLVYLGDSHELIARFTPPGE